MGATVYCMCNQKGGCAKSVSSVNLGIGLAHEGKRVLLCDVDSQGSLTASLGWQSARPDGGHTFHDIRRYPYRQTTSAWKRDTASRGRD